MGKNLFTQETGKFLVNDPKDIRKNANVYTILYFITFHIRFAKLR